jgi:DNA-binding transcriptional LysR family regulator
VLGLSVATVSRGVSRLEERLGARLFNRTSRRLALTDFGHQLAERASRIYRDAEEAESAAREQSSSPRGLVRLAVPMSFGLRWVAPLLPDFFRLYPDVSIDMHLSDAVVDLVGEGFDAALRIAVLPDPRWLPGACAALRRSSSQRRPILPGMAGRPAARPRCASLSWPCSIVRAGCLAFQQCAGDKGGRHPSGRCG